MSDARLAAALLFKEVTGLSQRKIGQALGLADGSGLGNLLTLADRRMKKSWRWRRTAERLRKHG